MPSPMALADRPLHNRVAPQSPAPHQCCPASLPCELVSAPRGGCPAPQVLGDPPRDALIPMFSPVASRPTRASAADPGVRPTIDPVSACTQRASSNRARARCRPGASSTNAATPSLGTNPLPSAESTPAASYQSNKPRVSASPASTRTRSACPLRAAGRPPSAARLPPPVRGFPPSGWVPGSRTRAPRARPARCPASRESRWGPSVASRAGARCPGTPR